MPDECKYANVFDNMRDMITETIKEITTSNTMTTTTTQILDFMNTKIQLTENTTTTTTDTNPLNLSIDRLPINIPGAKIQPCRAVEDARLPCRAVVFSRVSGECISVNVR